MSDKSHVSMEQHQCVVCGCLYDTGAILLDKRLRQSMERHTVTGTGLCPEHQKLKDDGYIALLEATPAVVGGAPLRTGRVAHIKQERWGELFNAPVPEGKVAFVHPQVMETLIKLQSAANEEKPNE